jgi:acetyl/propionyl-CoA carboxylase alpha subunit
LGISALGQKQMSRRVLVMSDIPFKTDIQNTIQNREQKFLSARALAGLPLQLLTAAGLGGMDAKGIH